MGTHSKLLGQTILEEEELTNIPSTIQLKI